VVSPETTTKTDANGNPLGGITEMDKEFQKFNIWL
jgi:hypothetical protein